MGKEKDEEQKPTFDFMELLRNPPQSSVESLDSQLPIEVISKALSSQYPCCPIEEAVTRLEKVVVVRRYVDVLYFCHHCMLSSSDLECKDIEGLTKEYRRLFLAIEKLVDFFKKIKSRLATQELLISDVTEAVFQKQLMSKFKTIKIASEFVANSLRDNDLPHTDFAMFLALISQMERDVEKLTLQDVYNDFSEVEGKKIFAIAVSVPQSSSESTLKLSDDDSESVIPLLSAPYLLCSADEVIAPIFEKIHYKPLRHKISLGSVPAGFFYSNPDLQGLDSLKAWFFGLLLIVIPYLIRHQKMLDRKWNICDWSSSVSELLVVFRVPVLFRLAPQWAQNFFRSSRDLFHHRKDDKGYPWFHKLCLSFMMLFVGLAALGFINYEDILPLEEKTAAEAMGGSSLMGLIFVNALVFFVTSLATGISVKSARNAYFFKETGLSRATILEVSDAAIEKMHKTGMSYLRIKLILDYLRRKWLKYDKLKHPPLLTRVGRDISRTTKALYESLVKAEESEKKYLNMAKKHSRLNLVMKDLRQGDITQAMVYLTEVFDRRKIKINRLERLLGRGGVDSFVLKTIDGKEVCVSRERLQQRLEYLKKKQTLLRELLSESELAFRPASEERFGAEEEQSTGFDDNDVIINFAKSESSGAHNPFNGEKHTYNGVGV